VRVNGVTAESFTLPVRPRTDKITYEDKAVLTRAPNIYLMLHKPAGLLSTTGDERGRRTVMDILPAKYAGTRLYPVGRLDKDTTGLLILTNDGNLTQKLTHPSYEKEKEYLVKIDGQLTASEIQQINRGLRLEDGITAPAAVKPLKDVSGFNYSLVIHEGKKRQVRRMFAHLGYGVKALKRIRLGKLYLGNLKEGEVRPLTPPEIRALH